jgi:7,8-didemethyl-8-hydroxy-5-deazariboflavin synthase CofH subunit/7,8-didemethyl-8-hydroxy-5-deazariboflavin synthase CofG subunit
MALEPSGGSLRIVTYSPKVFIPLTTLCRDRCGYCTFAQSPRHIPSPFLEPADVLSIASAGAEAGCHEALFTLGEAPEARYPTARIWLAERGYDSTVEYLIAMCQLVLDETGLLPHANAGALSRHELQRLRSVAPSQGMMIESLRNDLAAHRGAPDKDPQRRLDTMEAAGELAIPFTTGILVGIGEERHDRIAALEAIAAAHARWGHIQEVIVQNFLPKPGTTMREHPACPPDVHRDAIALARQIMPADVSVQAPPNLTDDVAALLDAGVDDLGGISPVTIDHVNPERPWPHLAVLADQVRAAGAVLVPRLTVYPHRVRHPERWLDPALHFAVQDRSDAEGFARDDPGATFPERYVDAANVGTGAEVVQVGRRSTCWYSGADRVPPTLIPREPAAAGAIAEVLDGVRLGQQVGFTEIVTLFTARGPAVAAIARLADELRAAVHGDAVTFVRNRNINYTNVCTYRCTFCGFSKGPLSLNLRGKPYLLDSSEITRRVREAVDAGATEICLQGGIHPSFNGDSYREICLTVKAAAPNVHIHGFTALELTEGARRLGEPLAQFLLRMYDAGLRSLPGTAAEILDEEVRATLCPDKITTDEWLECHEVAHGLGLRSNITIMFGSIERPEHWARHIIRTRDLQARTGGFTEFVPLPFVHMAAPIYLKRAARRGPTWREVVLMHAVGRIAYHGFVDNVQASWVKVGRSGAQQLLQAGVNDLGGTLIDENISRAAGASHGQQLTVTDFAELTAPLGRTLVERTTLYEPELAGAAKVT